jgi:prepilin-type processing-associated H-X9-DG protein
MDITFNCKSCGQSITIDEAGAGQEVQCPACGNSLIVPSRKPESVENTARPIPPLPTDDTKICPFCAETIKKAAKICRFCGSDLVAGKSSAQSSAQAHEQPIAAIRARSGIWDGVKLGCGMFIVLPLVLLGVAIAVIYGIYGGALFPSDSEARSASRRANCLSNEKQITLAIAMYADSNGGRCPMDSANPTLVGSMKLLSNVLTSAKVFHCPDDTRPGAHAATDYESLTALNISYSYVPNLKWQDTPDSPLILDRIYSTAEGSEWPSDGNHGSKGGNIGFNDGHVAWQSRLPAALKDKDGKEVVLSP